MYRVQIELLPDGTEVLIFLISIFKHYGFQSPFSVASQKKYVTTLRSSV